MAQTQTRTRTRSRTGSPSSPQTGTRSSPGQGYAGQSVETVIIANLATSLPALINDTYSALSRLMMIQAQCQFYNTISAGLVGQTKQPNLANILPPGGVPAANVGDGSEVGVPGTNEQSVDELVATEMNSFKDGFTNQQIRDFLQEKYGAGRSQVIRMNLIGNALRRLWIARRVWAVGGDAARAKADLWFAEGVHHPANAYTGPIKEQQRATQQAQAV